MDAAVLSAFGTPRFGSFPIPVAQAGEAVVEIAAAGLNPIDLTAASGKRPDLRPLLPSVPGYEGVGRLDGRRVYFHPARAGRGSMCERTLVRPDHAFPVPDAVPDGTAVALGIAGTAAWLPFTHTARLAPGEHVLVLGAGGVVGQLAIQTARLLGAGRVVAAARSTAGLRRARELGADAVVSLAGTDATLADALRDAAEGRLDVVLDQLWGTPGWRALEAASPGARLVQIGTGAGTTSPLTPGPLRGRMLSVAFYSTFALPIPVRRRAYADLCREAAAGRLRVDVEEVALRDVAHAWERQAAGPGRKLVLRP